MAKQIINTGSSELAGDGESVRSAFTKTNSNFTELCTALGLEDNSLNIGNVSISGNTLGTINNQNLEISENLEVTGNIIPSADAEFDLGSPSKQWRDIFVSTGSIYLGDVKLSNVSGQLVVQQVTDPGTETESAVPNTPGTVTTDRLVNAENTFVLNSAGELELNGEPFTAWTGGRVVSAPSFSTGAAGDQIGDIAFTGTYFYYCAQEYDGSTNIWRRVSWNENDTW